MIACKPADVKVVAIVIANTIPDAFAGFGSLATGTQFDLERDFSENERECFFALAGRIVDALAAARGAAAACETALGVFA